MEANFERFWSPTWSDFGAQLGSKPPATGEESHLGGRCSLFTCLGVRQDMCVRSNRFPIRFTAVVFVVVIASATCALAVIVVVVAQSWGPFIMPMQPASLGERVVFVVVIDTVGCPRLRRRSSSRSSSLSFSSSSSSSPPWANAGTDSAPNALCC